MDGPVPPYTAGSRGANPRICDQEAPHQASKQQTIFVICLSNKYAAIMRNIWPIITTHSPTLVQPYLSWFKGGIHAAATQGESIRAPKQSEIRSKHLSISLLA